jgi:hypothetical protein
MNDIIFIQGMIRPKDMPVQGMNNTRDAGAEKKVCGNIGSGIYRIHVSLIATVHTRYTPAVLYLSLFFMSLLRT